ncbi:unnamed protein product [Linum tenue]|uniref:CDP-diacylglycerol--glycerol-3-phosphate 1-phosphatidyltransferase n=1 Tax=Linum tenue TaxID=586396 RepID=A0AAV0MAC6_9ROSI|nr:unnamed protein product [Linum tenue]
MPSLKTSMAAASFSSKPYKWPRSSFPPSPSPNSSTAAAVPLPSPSSAAAAPPSLCSAPISCGRAWRRIPPCAHLAPFNDSRYPNFSCSSNNKKDIYFNITTTSSSSGSLLLLGLPGGSGRSPFSSSSSSLRNCGLTPFASKAGSSAGSDSSSSPSSPSGSGGVIAEDMGSDNKAAADGVEWYPAGDGVNGLDPRPSSSSSPSPDRRKQEECSSKFLTLPTILTLGRVASVPLLIGTFYVDTWLGRTATTSIFLAAAVTDWLDGYLARKMRLGSAFGAFLDPVADKLMVAATLVLLCTRPLEVPMFGPVPWLLTVPAIAIIGREITMSAVREWAASQDTKLLEAVAVNNLGKWKTATQMTALTILLATRDGGVGGLGAFVASGVGLLYISAGLSVYSLAVYMSKIWKVLLK